MNKAYRHVYKDGIGWVAIAENASCVSSSKGSGTVPGKTKVEVLKNFFDLRNSVVLNNGFLLKGLFAATLFCGVVVGDLKAETSQSIQDKAVATGGTAVYVDDGGKRFIQNKQGGYIDAEGKGLIKIGSQWYKVDKYDEKGVITLSNGKKYVIPTGTLNAILHDKNYDPYMVSGTSTKRIVTPVFFDIEETISTTNSNKLVRYDENDKKWYVYNSKGERLYLAKKTDGISDKYYGLHRYAELKKDNDGVPVLDENGYYIQAIGTSAEEATKAKGIKDLQSNLEEIDGTPDFNKNQPTRLSLVGLDGINTIPQKYKDDDQEVKDGKKNAGDNKNGKIRLGNVAKALQDDEAVNLGQLNEKLQNVKAKVPYVSIKSSITSDGSNYYSDGAKGLDSIAIGPKAKATDVNATAIGHNASAQRENAIAIGTNAQANAQNVVAIGESAGNTKYQNGNGSIFIGRNAGKDSNIIDPQGAENWGSVYIGQDAGTGSRGDGNLYLGSDAGFKHQGSQNIFLGDGARNLKDKQGSGENEITKGNRNIAIGNQYVHNPDKVYREDDALNDTITIGTATRASANGAIAIGSAYNYDYDERSKNTYYIATSANGVRSIALGSGILVNSKNGVAIGFGSGISDEKVTDAVALGSYSKADRKALDAGTKKSVYLVDDAEVVKTVANTKGAISVGSEVGDKFTRQITNVAAGAADTDAVNVAQLKALQNEGFYTEANLTASGNTNRVKHQLGSIIKVGGTSNLSIDKLSGENLATSINKDGSINLLMAKTPKFDDISISKDGDGKNYTNLTQWLKKIESSSSTSTGDKIKYFSVVSEEEGNKNNDGAKGNNSIAIGPEAKAGDNSVAIGLSARTGGKGVIDRYSYKTLQAFNDKLQRNIDEAVKKRDEAVENYNKAVTYPRKSIYERIKNEQEELINKYEKIKAKYEKMIGSYEGRYEYDGRLITKAEFDELSKDTQSKIKQTLKYISSNTFYENSVAIGYDAHTLSSDAVAIGNGAKVISNGGVAIGQGSVSDARAADLEGYEPLAFNITKNNIFEKNHKSTWVATDQPFAVGDDRSEEKITRQITGVAAGKKDTDAVNVAQLKQIGFKAAGDIGIGTIQNENDENNILNIKTNGSWENDQTNVVYTGKNLETKFTPYYTDQMKNKVYSTFAIAMTDTPRFKSITIADENTVNQDGKVVDKSDNSPIELKKFDNNIGFAGENNSAIKLTNLAEGTIGEDSKDAITGGQLQKIIKGGLKFTANSGEHTAELGSQISIKGAAANTDLDKFDSGENIMTNIDTDGNIVVGLSKELKNITSITNNGKKYTFGDTNLVETSVITNKDLTEKGYVTADTQKTTSVSTDTNSGITVDKQTNENNTDYKLSLDKGKIKEIAGTTNLKDDLAGKADRDAGNLEAADVASWQKKLGNGKNNSGNTGLITGDTLNKSLKDYSQNSDKTAKVLVKGDGLKLDPDETKNVAKYTLSLDEKGIKKLAGTEDLDDLKNKVKNKADIDATNVKGEYLTKWQEKLGVSKLNTAINNFNTNGMFKVSSNSKNPEAVVPNAVVDFTAGVGTDKNLIVSHEKTNDGVKVNYALNNKLKDIDSIGGNGKKVSFTNDGVDFDGAKITNVAQGSDDTDGVNLKQVRTLIANVGTTNLVEVQTNSPMVYILDKEGKPRVQLVRDKDKNDNNKMKFFRLDDKKLEHPITDGNGNFTDGSGEVGDQIKISTIHPGYGVADKTKITNVKAGNVTPDSLEAINGSQLHASNKAIAEILGGNSTLDDNGVVTKPTYNITNKNGVNIIHNNIGDALTELNEFNKNFTDNGLFSVSKDNETPSLKIKPNENISFITGSNLALTVEKGDSGKGAKITYSLKDELNGITSIASKTNKPLKVISNNKEFYFNKTDGTDDEKKRNVATIGDLASIDGNTTALIKAVAGDNKLNSNGTISQNADSAKTPFDPIKTASNPNGDTKSKTLFETVNNTIAAINEGFKTGANFDADNISTKGKEVKLQLGSTIKITGTSAESDINKLSGKNLATSINKDGSINLLMSRAPRFDSVNIGGDENKPDSGIKIAQDGKDGNTLIFTGEDGNKGVTLKGVDGINGKDGKDLLASSSDDIRKALGVKNGIDGKDGKDGKTGKDAVLINNDGKLAKVVDDPHSTDPEKTTKQVSPFTGIKTVKLDNDGKPVIGTDGKPKIETTKDQPKTYLEATNEIIDAINKGFFTEANLVNDADTTRVKHQLGSTIKVTGASKLTANELSGENLATSINKDGSINLLMSKAPRFDSVNIGGEEGKPDSGIKIGKDGKDGNTLIFTGEDGNKGVTLKGVDGINGKDGKDLLASSSDDIRKALGVKNGIDGKDGKDGKTGKDAVLINNDGKLAKVVDDPHSTDPEKTTKQVSPFTGIKTVKLDNDGKPVIGTDGKPKIETTKDQPKTYLEATNEIIDAVNKGFFTEANLTASADTNRVKHQLGSTIKVGGTSNLSIDKLSGENLATSINKDGSINLLMSKAPRFDSVNIGGDENKPDSGIKIAQGKDGNVLKLSKKGADGKDGKVILRGLADGKDDSDAVTKAQLNEVRDLANNSGANGIKNARFTTDDSKEAKFDENNKLAVNGDENIKTSTTDKGIKISLGDKIGFGNKVATKDKDGNEVKVSPVELGKDGLKITQDDGTAGPSVTKDGIDGGNKKLTNLASGLDGRSLDEIKADIKKANGDKAKMPKEVGNAATIGDLANVDTKVTNVQNITNNLIGGNVKDENGNDVKFVNDNGNLTEAGKEALTTNAVSGQNKIENTNIIQAINNINKQGTKFFHVNDGTQVVKDSNKDDKDSSAASKGGIAIGMKASVGKDARDAIAIGSGSQALAENTIAIGNGNVVKGKNSGAIGDPSIIDAKNSYSVGNNNKIEASTTSNNFILGNNAEITSSNSVALGESTKVSVEGGVALGARSVSSREIGKESGYDISTDSASTSKDATWLSTAGAVAVGDETQGITRQITGVAAGSQDTDAVNVAQLKAVQKISQSAQWISVNNENNLPKSQAGKGDVKGYTGNNSVAIGPGSTTKIGSTAEGKPLYRENTVSVGGVTKDKNGKNVLTQRTISNVAPGVLDSDAATMGQLRAGLNDVYGKLGEYKKDASAGTASALAVGNLPQATIPGKGMVSLGSGFYDGESAMAIGLSKMSDSGKWVFKGSASYDSQEKAGAALSVGFHF